MVRVEESKDESDQLMNTHQAVTLQRRSDFIYWYNIGKYSVIISITTVGRDGLLQTIPQKCINGAILTVYFH